MSVLIKGMEMPHNENDSIHILRDGTAVVYRTGSIDFYKAITVPEHGRFIDGDALRKEVKKHATPSDAWVFSLIRTAPTVIPADPADKEGEG